MARRKKMRSAALARDVDVVELLHFLDQIAGKAFRNALRLQTPCHDIDVVLGKQILEPVHFRFAPFGVIAIEEAADHVIGFARAAMPRAKARPGKTLFESGHIRHEARGKTLAPDAQAAISGGAMRPDILNPLFTQTDALDGVGPKLMKPLGKLGLERVRDIAYHLPDRFVTRRAVTNLDEAGEGEQVIVALTPTEHRAARNPGAVRTVCWRRMRRAISAR